MGKGKGSFDHWATRMAVSQILFEIKGRIHEQIVRDAFRLAGNKLPGISSRTHIYARAQLTASQASGNSSRGATLR
jgi:ribosomal protein L16/L10AE